MGRPSVCCMNHMSGMNIGPGSIDGIQGISRGRSQDIRTRGMGKQMKAAALTIRIELWSTT